jgi:ribose/xylose/arabinose/galactoside ABC-type transport system permease subunit
MKRRWIHEFILEGVLIVLCIGLSLKAPGFLTAQNLLGVLRNVSMQGVIAFGMTMVIIAGEIDLSVGSGAAFAGCVTAWITEQLTAPIGHWGMIPAISLGIFVALLAGIFSGCISGVLRAKFGVPTFISTLAWYLVLRGASGEVTSGFPITPFPDGFGALGAGYLWGIPVPAIIFLAVFLLIQFVMSYTTFGRAIYAVGGNAEAARLSGIPVTAVKIGVMAVVAALTVLAGVMESSQIMAGNPTAAQGWELDVIASVIVGGTSLAGGAGRVWGTLVGVVFLGVLLNGMTLMNVSEYRQNIVRGALILVAVLLNTVLSGRR